MKREIRKNPGKEDDPEDEYAVSEAIEGRFQVKPEVIRTESGFFTALEDISANPPDIIVLDVMLRWTDPSPDQQVRDDRKPFHTARHPLSRRLARTGANAVCPRPLVYES